MAKYKVLYREAFYRSLEPIPKKDLARILRKTECWLTIRDRLVVRNFPATKNIAFDKVVIGSFFRSRTID